MATPLVSVLTPVHNGQEHLEECIESVLRQTYERFELVIVDNGSDDGTQEISVRYQAIDPRIRYERHEELVDPIANHNRAFRSMSAESRYCKVVQADDWIYPECLEKMVDLAEAHSNVGVVGAYRRDGDVVDLVGVAYSRSVVPGREILRQSVLGGPYVTGTPTSLLLRSALVRDRDPFYEPSFRHADTEAAYWALARSDFGIVHQVLTYTRRQNHGETPVSLRVNSYSPENLRMLVRYGPGVLSEAEYRARFRSKLYAYVWWHAKQAVRPSRFRDHAFRSYQVKAASDLATEATGDRRVRSLMALVKLLLRRPGLPRPRRPVSTAASKRTSHPAARS